MLDKLRKSAEGLGIKRGDIAIAAALLAFSLITGIVMLFFLPSPKYAVITVDGNEIARLPLGIDCVYHIGDTNTVEISDGGAMMIEANCPDKVCMHTGRISHSGQSIVCLPNRVVVSVTGDSSSTDIYTH